ncbi:MAG: signal recognition particle-docking protein FtsY, partial [Nitrosopumilaceae archaeon]|nr:signal recognition particle-docking protein FtsY [Nitrosopumilaceae archaeon]
SSDDPFKGISDDDIAKYSDLYDVPPPENDDEAIELSKKIKNWIKTGKLEPSELKPKYDKTEVDDDSIEIEEQKKEEKPKKKRGMFGFFRK